MKYSEILPDVLAGKWVRFQQERSWIRMKSNGDWIDDTSDEIRVQLCYYKLDTWEVKPEDENIGKTVTVYDRYLFAVPVVGIIRGVADHKDKAFKVVFFADNPGGENVTKHDGKYFHREQCRVWGNDPAQKAYPRPSPYPRDENESSEKDIETGEIFVWGRDRC